MSEVAINVKLKGDAARLVDDIIQRGYSESKDELVRNSIILYAIKLGLISPKTLHRGVLDEIKSSRVKYTDNEIKEHLRALENE